MYDKPNKPLFIQNPHHVHRRAETEKKTTTTIREYIVPKLDCWWVGGLGWVPVSFMHLKELLQTNVQLL
jgi:hypothetical protein